jgi:hypothetical protein
MTAPRGLPRMSAMNAAARTARRLLMILALLGMAGQALPQTPGYTVEIVVFRNGGVVAAQDAGAPWPGLSGDDVEAVSVASRRLGGSVARLNAKGLRVLAQGAWKQEPTAFRSRRGVSAARLGSAGIAGKVILERGERLHLGVDLVVEDGGKRYRLNEVRQVKTDEINYFDHPAIGVLAIVTSD